MHLPEALIREGRFAWSCIRFANEVLLSVTFVLRVLPGPHTSGALRLRGLQRKEGKLKKRGPRNTVSPPPPRFLLPTLRKNKKEFQLEYSAKPLSSVYAPN